jgi:hypothetical protein
MLVQTERMEHKDRKGNKGLQDQLVQTERTEQMAHKD